MTDDTTAQLAELEKVAGEIDPTPLMWPARDGKAGWCHASCIGYLTDLLALAIRLDQARKWLDAWCEKRSAILTIVASTTPCEPSWSISVARDKASRVRFSSHESLAHTYASAIEGLEKEPAE